MVGQALLKVVEQGLFSQGGYGFTLAMVSLAQVILGESLSFQVTAPGACDPRSPS